MQRFFVTPDRIQGDKVSLSGDQSTQILRVLRMTSGEQIVVLDDTGLEYLVELGKITHKLVEGHILSSQPVSNEPEITLSLYLSPLKRENFELVLQKCTELGVSRFIPTICDHTVINRTEWNSKITRWERIIQEAAEQSTRGRLPRLRLPVPFETALKEFKPENLSFIAWEDETDTLLRSFLTERLTHHGRPLSASIMIGPEGGFSEMEINLTRQLNIPLITLGKRVLRAETAAIVTCALVLHQVEERKYD